MTVTTPTSPAMFTPAGLPMFVQFHVEPAWCHKHQRLKSLPSTKTCGLWAEVGVSITVTPPSGNRTLAAGGLLIFDQCHTGPGEKISVGSARLYSVRNRPRISIDASPNPTATASARIVIGSKWPLAL